MLDVRFLAGLLVSLLLLWGCTTFPTPHTVGDLSGAMPVELGGACSIYSRYGWDFENLDHSFVVDRAMLVAEDIYLANKTPERIRDYCLTEVFHVNQ